MATMNAIPRNLPREKFFAPGKLPVVVHYHSSVRPGEFHGHEFYELVIITGGSAVHEAGSERWAVSAGDVLVITGDRPHRYTELEKLSLYNVLFDESGLEIPRLDLESLEGYHALFKLEPLWRRRHEFESRLQLGAADLDRAEALAEALRRELAAGRGGGEFMAMALFMQLIGFLSRCYSKSSAPHSRSLLRIAGAISHIESRCDEEMTLAGLAAIAGLSKRSFQRSFREAMGSSPVDYLLKVRLRRGAQLLRGSDQSVTRIAFSVGFNDSNYFARAFRKIMGQSPREYRRAMAHGWNG
jgi:AraC-like DNA-binding protein